MKKIERETIRKDYIENIYKKSWTYERLSKNEKNNIIECLYNCKLYGQNKSQVIETLRDVYNSFLIAINYSPTGWRGD